MEQQQNVFDELTLLGGIWNKALETQWTKEPVWVHGDIAPGNLLVDKTGDYVRLLTLEFSVWVIPLVI